MRELQSYEVTEVSGSGILTTAGQYLGAGAGMILGMVIGNEDQQVTAASASVGAGLGLIAERSLSKLADFSKKAIKFFFW